MYGDEDEAPLLHLFLGGAAAAGMAANGPLIGAAGRKEFVRQCWSWSGDCIMQRRRKMRIGISNQQIASFLKKYCVIHFFFCVITHKPQSPLFIFISKRRSHSHDTSL
jgi:hypothetical protein